MANTKLKASRGTTATGTPDATTFLRGDNSWASAGATAGQVIQVVSTSSTTSFNTSSTSFTDVTGLSVSITPSATANKILIILDSNMYVSDGQYSAYVTLVRGSTNLGDSTTGFGGCAKVDPDGNVYALWMNASYLDSPNTTSSTTYKVQIRHSNGRNIGVNYAGNYNTGARSSITVMEIKG